MFCIKPGQVSTDMTDLLSVSRKSNFASSRKHTYLASNMADVAVDRNVSDQVRDIIFDAIKSIIRKSEQPDAISIIDYITRNLASFKEVELMDSILELVDSGILINKKTKQDLDSLFLNEGTLTDNTPQEQNNNLTDINPVDIETPNCTLVEASTKSYSDRFNNLKGKVNSNTTNFAAFKSFV